MVQASNGKLYAGINGGGSSAQGLIIEYDINTDSVIMKKDFNGTGVSAYNGTFIEVAPNKLYALSIIGGKITTVRCMNLIASQIRLPSCIVFLHLPGVIL
ncbi:MAG: hypothetical protein IPP34_10800 [Bacteroidetes bacterium]|nr:hypothetical protein [Bacteroidota bacterium]